MIRYLSEAKRKSEAAPANAALSAVSEAAVAVPGGGCRVNTSACVKRSAKPLLDLVLAAPGYQQVEDASDKGSKIYFVWDGKALLSRLGHPSVKDRVPQLPTDAWINRMPGMGCICDKVNMAVRACGHPWGLTWWPSAGAWGGHGIGERGAEGNYIHYYTAIYMYI